MKDIVIRKAKTEDCSTIADFNYKMALETEGKKLNKDTLNTGVKSMIADSNKGFYLVAELPEIGVVGCLMITFEWSDWRNGVFWWIQSVYIMEDFRRKGIYRKLYHNVVDIAGKVGNCCGIRLYVEKENRAAQKTYSSLGMTETYYKLFEAEFN